jgi:hypothetical protein
MSEKHASELKDEQVKQESDELLRQRVRELEQALESQRSASSKDALLRSLERELSQARAVDVEAVAVLAMASLEGENADAKAVSRVVRELKERRPRLFESGTEPGLREGSMGPMRAGSEAEEAAQRALETGHRRALLEYLRLRRK